MWSDSIIPWTRYGILSIERPAFDEEIFNALVEIENSHQRNFVSKCGMRVEEII